jgi:hypothetical protein
VYITPVSCYRARRALALAFGPRRAPARWLVLAGIALTFLALAVRLLYLADLAPSLYTAAQPGVRMATRYGAAATAILAGDGVLYPRVWPEREETGLVSRPPGYPALLAAIYGVLGQSYTNIQTVQVVCGALLPTLLLVLMTRLAGFGAGLASGFLSAVSPPLAYHCGLVTPDSVSTTLAVAFVLVLWQARRSRCLALAAAGAVGGLTTWLRPNFLLLCVLLAPLLPLVLGRARRTLAGAGLMALVSLAIVAPITIRNARLYGELVPVSSNGGIVLWEGIADAGGERFGAQRFDVLVALEEAERSGDSRYAEWWASPDGIRRDRERVRRSLEVIRNNPAWFARATILRAIAIADVRAAAPLLAAANPRLREGSRAATATVVNLGRELASLRTALRSVQDVTMLLAGPFAAVGLALLLALAPRRTLLLLFVPLYVLAMQAPMHFEPRFALPLYAFLPAFQGVTWALIAVGGARFCLRLRARPLRGEPR